MVCLPVHLTRVGFEVTQVGKMSSLILQLSAVIAATLKVLDF